jgi:pyrroloquinoline-quinone synthase
MGESSVSRGAQVTDDFMSALDAIIEERSLLKHPFYQAWSAGTLPAAALREYAKQYFHFEAAFPTFLSAVHSRCGPGPTRQAILENLWDEEQGAENHLALWLRFCRALGLEEAEVRASEPNEATRALIDGFDAACREGTVAQGLAALYAYESQAPAVAEAKIEGLRRFYHFEDASNYAFFSVHRELDVEHSGAERAAVVAAATDESARRGLEEATRAASGHLWRFLDGAYAGSCN